jgi:4-nitrophenyl phosphatase
VFSWKGRLWPGTGSLAAAIEAASGQLPIILGKPSENIYALARTHLRLCQRIIAVGDDLQTDIAGAQRCGIETVLVLSGVTSLMGLERSSVKPDAVCESLMHLANVLNGVREAPGK